VVSRRPAWIGAAGEGGAEAGDWRTAWGGGLVTTCGLDNVGAPSEGVGLHGTYTFLEARDAQTERSLSEIVVRGAVLDPRGLRVDRTIGPGEERSTRIAIAVEELA